MGRPVAAAETDRGSHWGSAMLRRQSTRDCEPQIFVLSLVAHDLIHRTSELAGVAIKSSLDPYAAVSKNPKATFLSCFCFFRKSSLCISWSLLTQIGEALDHQRGARLRYCVLS